MGNYIHQLTVHSHMNEQLLTCKIQFPVSSMLFHFHLEDNINDRIHLWRLKFLQFSCYIFNETKNIEYMTYYIIAILKLLYHSARHKNPEDHSLKHEKRDGTLLIFLRNNLSFQMI
jgi:hypothetical protein